MTNSPLTPINSTSEPEPDSRPGALRRLWRRWRTGELASAGRLKQDRLSWPVWLAIAYAGVVLPVLCHGSTWFDDPNTPAWQSGNLDDQVGFVLNASAGFVLYPLMLYPLISLSLLLFREERFASNYLVRFGIFSGLPVAAWYCIIQAIIMFEIASLLSPQLMGVLVAWGFGIVTPFALWAVVRVLLWTRRKLHIPWKVVVVLAILIAGGIACAISLSEGADTLLELPLVVLAVSMIFGAYWCFDAYLAMTLRLQWRYPQPVRFTILQLMAAMSWLAAFLAACRWAVILSLEQYSKLPLDPPNNCYIATAAARGHTRFVRAREIRSQRGVRWRINRQLTVLKAAELALRTLAPRLHAQIRASYDRLGPIIARRIGHPLLADLAYLALKPFEWSSHLLLTCLLGPERHRIERLYLRDESRREQ